MEEALKKLYYNPSGSGSFGGVDRLYRNAIAAKIPNITRAKVREFLAGQQAYKLHRPAWRHFKCNSIYSRGIDRQWQADLADMQAIANEIGNARNMLTVIDVFTKYA